MIIVASPNVGNFHFAVNDVDMRMGRARRWAGGLDEMVNKDTNTTPKGKNPKRSGRQAGRHAENQMTKRSHPELRWSLDRNNQC